MRHPASVVLLCPARLPREISAKRACSSQEWRPIDNMLQQARSALGVAARSLGRSLDGMGAALETHPYTEKCKSATERD